MKAINTDRKYQLTLSEYNESRTIAFSILTGKEYRRMRRKNKKK
jgi:hypothetical protein